MEQPTDRNYWKTAGALMALLGLTILLSFVNLGPFNFTVALLIAAAKALLVILFFMEVRFSSRTIWIIVLASVFWLLLLFSGVLTDQVTRVPLSLPFP